MQSVMSKPMLNVQTMVRGIGAGLVASLLVAAAPATAATVNCEAFKSALLKSSDLQIEFIRPLVVTRFFGNDDELLDLVTKYKLDGSLRCRAGRLVRFEAKVAMPADDKLLQQFARVQRIATAAALSWQPPRVEAAVKTLNQEAGEYLQASIERGDVYSAGKTEYHEGGADLGMIYTPTDRAFIIAGD